MESQTKSKDFKRILEEIFHGINNGQSLAETLRRHPRVFDTLYRSIVAIGEESGNLETNLEYLAGSLGKAYEFQKKVKSAMLYPAIVMIATIISGLTMVIFVLPQMVTLFKSLSVDLPPSTRLLIFVANVSKDYGLLLLFLMAAAVTAFYLLIQTPTVKPRWHELLLSLPIFGKLLTNIQVAYMCRNLGLMLRSGLPITTALKAASDASANLVFKDYLARMLVAMEKGVSLEAQMGSKYYRFVPLIVVRMIGVGEKSGTLDESLMYLADFFEEEVDDTTKNLSTILEPVMLIGIALMVGFVAFSIISPIYSLAGGVHR